MQITHMVANLIRPNRDPRIFQNPEHGITKNLISRLLGLNYQILKILIQFNHGEIETCLDLQHFNLFNHGQVETYLEYKNFN